MDMYLTFCNPSFTLNPPCFPVFPSTSDSSIRRGNDLTERNISNPGTKTILDTKEYNLPG